MKRLMIVEDEIYMAEFLAEIVLSSRLDIKLCGSYHNGKEAFEAISACPPDVCVTDIKMPEMDGLELIRKASTDYPNIKFVVISGYDDFHKVKEAFKLGVGEYFLKSEFDPDEFISTIEKLIRQKTSEDLIANPNYLLVIKENLLRELIWGGHNLPANNYGLRLKESNMCIMVIKISNYAEIEANEWDKSSELLKYAILNISKEILDDEDYGDVCIKNNNEIVYAFSGEDFNQSIIRIRSISKKSIEAFSRHLGFVLSIGLSGITNQRSQLVKKYNEAVEAADYAFIKGRGVLIQHGVEIQKTTNGINTAALYKEFIYYKDNLDFRKMNELFGRLSVNDISINCCTKLLVFCSDIFGQFLDLAKKYGIEIDKQRYNKLMLVGTFDRVIEFFKDIANLFSNFANNKLDIVTSVKLYIDKNYSSDLKLHQIAHDFNIDYAYLSKQFTLKTEMNFTKYLALVRMKNAVELIMTTSLKLNEIASWVGYNNYENFNREFRRQYGMSPKEFKKEQGRIQFDDSTE